MKNIKSFIPVFPGFYSTIFEASEDHIIEDDNTYDNYEFDYKGYELDVAKQCVVAVESQLNELGFNLSIKFENVSSPAYYNYSNDCIYAVYKLKRGCVQAIRDYLKNNVEAFRVYLKDHYTTCSGFISWYSNDVYDWLQYANFKEFARNGHYLGAMLEFICANEDFDQWALYYDTIDRYGISLDGWLKEVEPETDETEIELGALWQYTSLLDQAYNYIFNPNQLTLNF